MAAVLAGRDRRAGRAALCRTGAADHAAVRRRQPDAGAPARAHHTGLWPLRPQGGDAARAARRAALAARTVPRADAGVQGRRAAIARAAVRGVPRAHRGAPHHRRRDFGRYRIGGDRCGCRPRADRHLHAPPQGPGERRPAPADDHGARAQRPQHRHRRYLRRCPGDGEAHVQRSGDEPQPIRSARSIRSTGRG